MEPRLTFYKSRPDSLTAIQGDALDTNNAALENFTELAGRVLPALLFSLSGLSKLGGI
jgi:hypothetical protein